MKCDCGHEFKPEIHSHRIMCGDINNPDHLKKLKLPEIDLVLCDPPFLTTDLKFDKTFDFETLIKIIKTHMKINGWMFLFAPFKLAAKFLPHLKYKFEYIWIKSAPVIKTHNTIKPFTKHEICWVFISKDLKKINDLYFDKKSLRTSGTPYVKHNLANALKTEFNTANRRLKMDVDHTITNDGYREGTSILEFHAKSRMTTAERTEHPTQKPIDLLAVICKGYCPKGGTILDPTLGSGSTLIACEQTGRTCIGCEIEPAYVDVILARYKSLTGKKAKKA